MKCLLPLVSCKYFVHNKAFVLTVIGLLQHGRVYWWEETCEFASVDISALMYHSGVQLGIFRGFNIHPGLTSTPGTKGTQMHLELRNSNGYTRSFGFN